jgi:hypothetical protein
MCDYSLHSIASRPAKAGDRLVTSEFRGTTSRGFCAVDKRGTAVCLAPGTELAFAEEPVQGGWLASILLRWGVGRIDSKLARFRKLHPEYAQAHHDALEFANGKIVYLTSLRPGQKATVLQLPADTWPPAGRFAKERAPDRADAQ